MKSTALTILAGLLAMWAVTACRTSQEGSGSATIELFNGKDLKGWKHVLADAKAAPEGTWSVKNGVLVCTGTPLGFLYSDRAFTNFRMTVEYRWAPGAKPGNSGLFSRIGDTSKALPRTVEVQLMHGNAGDVLTLQGMMLAAGQARYFEILKHELAGDIRGVKKLEDKENPAGEWNRVEILAEGGNYTVWMNGQKINAVTGIETLAGPVGLQSEGGEIHFRRVTITPLPRS